MVVSFREKLQRFVKALLEETKAFYGDRLISFALFGSLARGTPRPDSDIDFLIVARRLSRGRLKRAEEFYKGVETKLENISEKLRKEGIYPSLSPVFKTPDEVKKGSPLFLDMTCHVRILYDRDKFLQTYLEELSEKLESLGSKRVQRGNAWFWVLKPDYREGDIIDL